VLLVAPTGVSAFNIGGMTIHATFLLGKRHNYQSLSSEKQNALYNRLQYLSLVIIDEVSMVGSDTLFDIHRRLKEIMGRSEFDESIFGNVSILAVGDLYQLQPVKQRYIFEPPSNINAQLCGSLWENFKLHELTTIMRQKEDLTFAQLLNRIRTGSQKSSDMELLQTRITKKTEITYPLYALHVFSTNKLTDEHNDVMMKTLPDSHYKITAIDSKKDINTGQVHISMPQKSSETGGLHEILNIAKGCRVMLTANLDVSDRLVNGATGTVEEIEVENDIVQHIMVHFDRKDVGQKASWRTPGLVQKRRHEVKFLVGRHYKAEVTRKQFPLVPAWGCTIHNVQGISVDQIVVNLSGRFNPGQAYVALSRVRTFSGLHLLEFSASKFTCSSKVTREMEALHKKSVSSVTETECNNTTVQSEASSTRATVHHINQQTVSLHLSHAIQQDRLRTICDRFMLPLNPHISQIGTVNKELTYRLQQLAAVDHGQNVVVFRTAGDGNCLFRAISLGLTNSQHSHQLIRNHVINFLLDNTNDNTSRQEVEDIANMGRDGVWGTDAEITAAAELFHCWIICCSRYGSSSERCLQYFFPHGIDGDQCTAECQHATILLINANDHYDFAAVQLQTSAEE